MIRYYELYREFYNEHFKDYSLSIKKYSSEDILIEEYHGTFKEICDKVESLDDKSYYRFSGLNQNTIKGSLPYERFHTTGKAKGGYCFDIDYLMHTYLNKEMCRYFEGKHTMFMDYYSFFNFVIEYATQKAFVDRLVSYDGSELKDSLELLKGKYKKLQECKNLNLLDKKSGIYIMVLDKYNSCYVGQSGDMKARIKQHWSADRSIDIQGIDLFKVGDTTDILIYECSKSQLDTIEQKIISYIPPRYTLNWLEGGVFTINSDTFFPYKDESFEEIRIGNLKKAFAMFPDVEKLFGVD